MKIIDMSRFASVLRDTTAGVADCKKGVNNFWARESNTAQYLKLSDSTVGVIDGFMMVGELNQLVTELRRAVPSLDFVANMNSVYKQNIEGYRPGGNYLSVKELLVYVRGTDYTIGRIGYSDAYTTKATYWVSSPRIKNDKYKNGNPGYFTLSSSNLGRALKNALGALRPLTATEIGVMSHTVFDSKIYASRSAVYNRNREAFEQMANPKELMSELRSLVERGVQFTSPEFTQKVHAAIAEQDAWEAKRSRSAPACFVVVSSVGGQQYVEIQHVTDMVNLKQGKEEYGAIPVQRLRIEDAPEHIVGKLSVLCLAECNQYMDEVGYRVTENTFWVEV